MVTKIAEIRKRRQNPRHHNLVTNGTGYGTTDTPVDNDELLRQNKKHRRKLQKKEQTLCYELEEDWTDECLPLSSTPAYHDVAVQMLDVEDTRLPIQREVSTDTIAIRTSVVDRGCQVDVSLLELPLQTNSVSVDTPAQERFEFWLGRKQQLLREIAITQNAFDDLLADMLQQMGQVSRPSNAGD